MQRAPRPGGTVEVMVGLRDGHVIDKAVWDVFCRRRGYDIAPIPALSYRHSLSPRDHPDTLFGAENTMNIEGAKGVGHGRMIFWHFR